MDKKKLDFQLSYDAKNDVLYCSLGEPREAYSVEMEDGVFARLDADTNTAVGVTVVDFYKKFAAHPGKMLSFPLTASGALRCDE
jgi:hypothetical protein